MVVAVVALLYFDLYPKLAAAAGDLGEEVVVNRNFESLHEEV